MKDYYKILELPFGSSSVEIKSAYRKLAFKYHPDKNFNDRNAEEKFKEITEAYTVLCDDNRRIIYHAEYNDFLNNRYINRIPEFQTQQKRYYKPTYIPKQPKGPASSYKDNFTPVRIFVFTGFILMIVYLLFQSNKELKEKELKHRQQNNYKAIIDFEESDTITTDKFHQLLSQRFKHTKDSALLNSNIDSLKHIFDSLKKEYRLKH